MQEADESLAYLRRFWLLDALLDHPPEPGERVCHFVWGRFMKDA